MEKFTNGLRGSELDLAILGPAEYGDFLISASSQIITRFVDRAESEVPAARHRSRTYIQDHLKDVLKELGDYLITDGRDRDHQKSTWLADKHGKQRADCPDYGIDDLRQEYSILVDEIMSALPEGREPSRRAQRLFAEILSASQSKATETFVRNSASEQMRQLAETERLVSLASDAIPDLMAYLDVDGRYRYVNRAYEQWFGKPLDAMLGKKRAEFISPERNKKIERYFERALEGETITFEDNADYADGFKFIRFTMIPDVDPETNRIRGVVTLVQDESALIRARDKATETAARAREAESRLRDAVAVARIGFFDWNIQTDKFVVSDQFSADWGVENGVGITDIVALILPEDRDSVQKLIDQAIVDGKPYRAQYRIRRQTDGLVMWIEAEGRVTKDNLNQPHRFFGTTLDITERKALESEMQSMVNAIPQLAWMGDSNGHLFWYNQRWQEFTGASQEEMKKLGWAPFHHPEHLERASKRWFEHLAEGKPWEDVFPLRAKNGEWRWFLSRAEPIRDLQGNIFRWFGTNTDITEQTRVERDLARMASVVQSSSDFIGMSDHQLNPLFVNRAGRYMSGFGDRDITKYKVLDFFPKVDQTRVESEVIPALQKDGYWEGELHFQHFETGALIPVFYNLFTIRNEKTGEILGYATNTQDITERKKLERSLRDAKEEADRANQLKSAFLANMSHEIRTPLGAILGFNDLLRDPGITAGERANYVNIVARNGAQLSIIIDDILDLSKVEAGHLTLEYRETDHRKIGADVVSLLQVKANEKDLSLEYTADPSTPDVIISDPTRVRQILLNLTSNAIKFTKFGSVRIRSFGCSGEGERQALCFEVSDTGIGLSEAQRVRLFKNFSQADETTTRRFGGTGLGLALSRQLARALGGDITVAHSEENVGTTFLVKINNYPEKRSAPEDRFKPEMQHGAEMKGQALAGLKILVVDDSPDNQQLIWRYLTKAGAIVESAENGQLGYRRALSGNFDLVLMDIQMPVMDGYTATAKLRDAGYTVPIVALTAHAMNDIRKKALNVGYTDHLTKPIDPKSLITTIFNLTRKENHCIQ